MTRIVKAAAVLVLAVIALAVLLLFRKPAECSENPPFFLAGTHYDCNR